MTYWQIWGQKSDVIPNLPISGEPVATACIIDGMAIVHMVRSGGTKTFGQLAEKYYDIISEPLGKNGCKRIDVVFDRYHKPVSINAGKHLLRGLFTALEIKILGPSTPVPKQWDKYIHNPYNKANLCAFICERWCETVPKKL